MAFFQVALLAGYLYAHLGPAWLGTRRHAFLHVGLCALVGLLLPARPPTGWVRAGAAPGRSGCSAGWRSRSGPTFVLLAATAPLVQRWLAATESPSRGRSLLPLRGEQRGQHARAARLPGAAGAALRPRAAATSSWNGRARRRHRAARRLRGRGRRVTPAPRRRRPRRRAPGRARRLRHLAHARALAGARGGPVEPAAVAHDLRHHRPHGDAAAVGRPARPLPAHLHHRVRPPTRLRRAGWPGCNRSCSCRSRPRCSWAPPARSGSSCPFTRSPSS